MIDTQVAWLEGKLDANAAASIRIRAASCCIA